jgi:DNA-directed RNA polymerase specialized sigma24 family protein
VDERPDYDELLPAIASGDRLAFGRFIAGVEIDLRRSLRPFAALVDVEAIVQESLLRGWQLAPRVEPDGRRNSLLRFVSRIARNLALSDIRRRREELPGDETLSADVVDPPSVPDPLLRRVIADCFELLPKQPRAAIGARIESAGSDADTLLAERSGMKLNTFLQNVTRARKLLGECLETHGVALEGDT